MPKGENAWNQLLNGKRRRSKDSLTALTRELWRDFAVAGIGLDEAMRAANHDELHRWLHIRQQIASAYLKVVLDAEIEPKLEEVRRILDAKAQNKTHR